MKIEADIRRYRTTGIIISVFAALWLLAACSTDDAQQEDMEEVRFEVRAVTRGDIHQTEYGDIRVFLTYPDVDEVYTGIFKYDSSKGNWRSQDLKVKPGTRIFYLYGYMPSTELPSGVPLKDLMNEADYTLTIPNISPLTTDDICFVTGVVRSTKEEEQISRGYYTFRYENSDYAEQTILNLLLEHLYGRLIFKFRIGDDYSNLRKIKLTKVSIEAVAQKLNAKIKLPESSGDIVSVTYTPSGGASETIHKDLWPPLDPEIPESEKFLKTEAEAAEDNNTFGEINVAVGSGLSETYELVCEYEVYDKKGNLLRSHTAAAGNAVRNSLKNVLPDMGFERTLKLTIEPTYLYQLSNVDLDNPTVKINE